MKRKVICAGILGASVLLGMPSVYASSNYTDDQLINAGLAAFSVGGAVDELGISSHFTHMAERARAFRDGNALADQCDSLIFPGAGNDSKFAFALMYSDSIGTGNFQYVAPTYTTTTNNLVDSNGDPLLDADGNQITQTISTPNGQSGIDYGTLFFDGQCDLVIPAANLSHPVSGKGTLQKNKVSELLKAEYGSVMNPSNGGYIIVAVTRDDVKVKGMALKTLVFAPQATDFNSWAVFGCFDEFDNDSQTRLLSIIGGIIGNGKKGQTKCGSNTTGYGLGYHQNQWGTWGYGNLWGSHVIKTTVGGQAKTLHYPGPITAGLVNYACSILDDVSHDLYKEFPVSTGDSTQRLTCQSLTDVVDPNA